jgi:dephospho-CoA kinase
MLRRTSRWIGLAVACLLVAQTGAAWARKRVVVVVGLPGSGKTTLSKALSRTMKVPYYKCGDVVRNWISARGLSYTPANDRRASQHFAKTPGEIARQLSLNINSSPGKVHIVDGVRSPADMKVLRKNFDVRVVALKLPAKIRHKRMLARGRFANVDKDYLRGRDRREIGLGVLHTLRSPFTRIDMRGPLDQVPSQAKQLATQLKKSWGTGFHR